MDNKDMQAQLEKLKKRISYDEDIFTSQGNYEQVLNDLLEDSMYIGLSILFPFEDFSTIEFPKRYYNWQLRTCVELYNLAGQTDIASYSENGLSWTKFKSGLPTDLLNELISKVGVPKRIKTEENTESEDWY